METPFIVNLTFRKEDFEEFYFVKENRTWLLNSTVKGAFIVFLLGSIGMLYSIFFDSLLNNQIFPLYVILFLGLAYNFYEKFKIFYLWRKQVVGFIEKNTKYKTHTLEVSSAHIHLKQDDTEHLERLDQITSLDITKDSIMFSGVEGFLILRKSMSYESFESLSKLLTERIKLNNN